MNNPQTALERAIAIARRDQLHPIPCARQDTGEAIWLVQSRSQPSTYYLLTKSNGHIRCQCPAAQHGQVCAHAAAVHLLLKHAHPSTHSAHTRTPARPSTSRNEEERQCREATLRRERALLWTDDKPFSIWKA